MRGIHLTAGNSTATGEVPSQRPVTRSFDIFFDLRLNKWLSKQSQVCWFETQSCALSRHCNGNKTDDDYKMSMLLTRVVLLGLMILLKVAPAYAVNTLHWSLNGRDSVSNHQPHHCLLNRLFRRRSKKASKLRVTGLCAGKSPETSDFPAQMAGYAENVSIW